MTSNDIPLANRTDMLFLHNGVLPHFNSAAINNSTSAFQNYWIGRNGPLQWLPHSACAAALVSFMRFSKDYHYCICLALFANVKPPEPHNLFHTFIFFSSSNTTHFVHIPHVNLNDHPIR